GDRLNLDFSANVFGKEWQLFSVSDWDSKAWMKGELSGTVNFKPTAEILERAGGPYLSFLSDLGSSVTLDFKPHKLTVKAVEDYRGNTIETLSVELSTGKGKRGGMDPKAEYTEIHSYYDWQDYGAQVDTTELFKRMVDAGVKGTLANKTLYELAVRAIFGFY
ncbi:MAG: hypothetical protein K6A92_07980, partial [Lachnospiraceae bacterium]|nr:hypothetical protein [Lachnospiraceae bacterium]